MGATPYEDKSSRLWAGACASISQAFPIVQVKHAEQNGILFYLLARRFM